MENVVYLVDESVDDKGKLSKDVLNYAQGRPILVMCQGSFCGWCQKAKPEFEFSAVKNEDILHASIEIDGDESEKKLASRIDKYIDNYKGVPHYALL